LTSPQPLRKVHTLLKRPVRKESGGHSFRLVGTLTATLGVLLLMVLTSYSSAQVSYWSEPVNISNTPNNSWFPDLAVDSSNNVHVVWCETTDRVKAGLEEGWERAFYTMWDGTSWSEPNDIIPPTEPIIRNAMVVDEYDVLHLTFRYYVPGHFTGIYYSQAPAISAWSALSWSKPRLISARGMNYASDLALDKDGTLHVVFDDQGDAEHKRCPSCADIYYRRSTDRGRTWSPPVNLSGTPLGSSREQIEIDASGTIHVTWDEGWDRLSGRGDPIYSAYTFSTDIGLTWQEPITIAAPITTTAQLAVGADGQGGAMLVWRIASRRPYEHDGIYYQWSSDGGISWSEPTAIAGIFPRPWSGPFDRFDLATDSAGNIHLVAVGRESEEWRSLLRLYHLVWDGDIWSAPEVVFQGGDAPEYPRIVINQGNRLHVVWFTRPEARQGNYEIWYSWDRAAAPYQTPVPTPSPTLPSVSELAATDTAPQPANPTPFPTVVPGTSQWPGDLYTEYDELLQLAMGLSPVLLIVAIVWVLRRRK
jgi:hypothetical protein